MDKTLSKVQRKETNGACWTCLEKNQGCDGALPRCTTCARRGVKCRGYGVVIQWPASVAGLRARARQRSRGALPSQLSNPMPLPGAISSMGLPAEESFFMQHFMQNISRIALAIDYSDNGYRSLLPLAMQDTAVLSALVAVAASHYSRWQGSSDKTSRRYLRAAAQALRRRFSTPELVYSPITLACMLLFVSYEVFSGSVRWKGHYDAICGWVRSRGDCSDLDPFLKTWVCMLDTQCSLNLGLPASPELESWLHMPAAEPAREESVDALFGCSSRMPRLMYAAARLYAASKSGQMTADEVRQRASALQTQIGSTEMSLDCQPLVRMLCNGGAHPYVTTESLDHEEFRRRMVATANIFRHCMHIYVYRIVHGPEEPLTAEIRASLDAAKHLLTEVPDAVGPGANLGWCLVVLGAEMDLVHDRDYIRSRWAGMHLLGIYNTKNGQRILDEVWAHRDLASQGLAVPERWQDTMQRIGQQQILI
ncbi:hypothetical protein CDD83_6109 [Cordyceps sp. RAO-2017]|nr:hypothetical protein CDD83_6109 [Cordyceps sp. RAO-2017]